jgi:hypothetical protein
MEKLQHRLPKWLNGLWFVAMAVLLFLKVALGHAGRDVWGTISVATFAALFVGTLLYNKAKTGRCFPNRPSR